MKAARLAFVLAAVLGGTVLGSGTAFADCSDQCSVGGTGTGGVSSGGSAQGFHYVKPAPADPTGSTVTNSGNQIGGEIVLTGELTGMAGGAYTPQEMVVSHYTGDVAYFFLGSTATCNGVCG